MKKIVLMMLLTAITITATSQERGDNLIVARLNIETERDVLLAVNKQLTANGWSVAQANMDFLFIETTKRQMERFATHLTLHISVSGKDVYIRGNWYNEAVFGDNPQRMGFARSKSNVQNEMWLKTMSLVNSLNPEIVTFKKE